MSIYEQNLDRNPANCAAITGVLPAAGSARLWTTYRGDLWRTAYTYAEFLDRARRLASALANAGIGKGDTVALMAPNFAGDWSTPETSR
jgi:3-(methylthio)propionyl---CoA ligase